MMPFGLEKLKHSKPLSLLKDEGGYLLIVVTVIGLILAILFGVILPQLHSGQQTRAVNNLNEYRAREAARRGIHTVEAGTAQCDNLLDLMGYGISGVTDGNTFEVGGRFAYLFQPGTVLNVSHSPDNDGSYTVSAVSEYVTAGGVTVTGIGVTDTISGNTGGVLCRDRGLLFATDLLTGASGATTYRDEYLDEDGNVQFVAGCRGIDLGGNEVGELKVLVIVARGGIVSGPADGNPLNDGWYFYDSGVTGPDGRPWLSPDNWLSGSTDQFEYVDGSVRYYDLDLGGDPLDGTNYQTRADLKTQRVSGKWYFSMGMNGAWRGQYGGQEFWNFEKEFLSGITPFQGKDNDGDGDIDPNDEVEVFVVVRSTGITAAPGNNYGSDKNDLKLVNDVYPQFPNPMRQALEGGFYLENDE